MGFYMIVFGLAGLAAIASVIYVTVAFHRIFSLGILKKLGKTARFLLSMLPLVSLGLIAVLANVITSIVIWIHIAAFLLLCDIVSLCFKKLVKDKAKRLAWTFVIAMALCAGYLCYGAINAVTVVRTDYSLSSEKLSDGESITIAQITDSHLGTTMDGERFAGYVEEICSAQPDILVVTGDFIDEDTTNEDMLVACRALGKANTRYGVYFVFGNHDQNSYGGSREFSTDTLRDMLTECGVVVLEDESVLVDDRFYVCGRRDASYNYSGRTRASAAEITSGLDKSKYIVMLDHQPIEYREESDAGVDLLLSGHSHGGQMIPLGIISELLKANDQVYGHEKVGGADCIVSAGISAWGIPLRTGVVTEYVIIGVEAE